MLFQKNHFVISVLCASLLALTACQDKSTPQSSSSETEPSQSVQADEHQHDEHDGHEHEHDDHEHEHEHGEHDHDDHHHHDMDMTGKTEFQQAYLKGMAEMHDDMMESMTINDADVAFAKGMLPHHEGAVDMAKVQLKYGKDETMRKLAEDIIKAQEPEIKLMEKWLEEHPDTEKQDNTEEVQKAYHQSMQAMHDDMMTGIQSDDADMAFAKGMLPHHQGAVAMAEVQLKYGKDEVMRKLAEDIIKAQQSEIELMQKWIKEHS